MDRFCKRKRCYRSTNEAKRAMRRLGARLRTYHCPMCNFWHLTKRMG